MLENFKKLVLVYVTFAPITKTSKNDELIPEKIPYIHYLLCFCKDKKNEKRVLIDLSSKVNAITLRYNIKIGLKICFTNNKAQKIDDSTFKTFEIVLISFQIKDK